MHNDINLKNRIAELEEELKTTKYNKRTQHSVGLLKAKIARLKGESQKKSSKKINADSFAVKKTGDATAVLVGFPSVGKSTILNKITDANSAVAAYAFTTTEVIPGMLHYNKVRIQLFDVPGLIEGASEGKGRGREVLSCINVSDLIIVIVDATHPEQIDTIMSELYEARVRLSQKKPDVKIVKRPTGGIHIVSVKMTKMDSRTVADILREFRYNNADIVIRDDIDASQFIDVLEGNKLYIPGVIVLNKIDLVTPEQLAAAKARARADVCISAETNIGLEELKAKIFERLGVIRVYCKEAGKQPDYNEPMVLKAGSTIRDGCLNLHKDFIHKFRFARIWGRSVKFDGQKVLKLEHRLSDGDTLEIHI